VSSAARPVTVGELVDALASYPTRTGAAGAMTIGVMTARLSMAGMSLLSASRKGASDAGD